MNSCRISESLPDAGHEHDGQPAGEPWREAVPDGGERLVHTAALSREPTVPITVAPRWCDHCTTTRPPPLAAACTSTRSPRHRAPDAVDDHRGRNGPPRAGARLREEQVCRSVFEIDDLDAQALRDRAEVPVAEVPHGGPMTTGDDRDEDVRNRRLQAGLLELAEDASDILPVGVVLGKMELALERTTNPLLVGVRSFPKHFADDRPAHSHTVCGDGVPKGGFRTTVAFRVEVFDPARRVHEYTSAHSSSSASI